MNPSPAKKGRSHTTWTHCLGCFLSIFTINLLFFTLLVSHMSEKSEKLLDFDGVWSLVLNPSDSNSACLRRTDLQDGSWVTHLVLSRPTNTSLASTNPDKSSDRCSGELIMYENGISSGTPKPMAAKYVRTDGLNSSMVSPFLCFLDTTAKPNPLNLDLIRLMSIPGRNQCLPVGVRVPIHKPKTYGGTGRSTLGNCTGPAAPMEKFFLPRSSIRPDLSISLTEPLHNALRNSLGFLELFRLNQRQKCSRQFFV